MVVPEVGRTGADASPVVVVVTDVVPVGEVVGEVVSLDVELVVVIGRVDVLVDVEVTVVVEGTAAPLCVPIKTISSHSLTQSSSAHVSPPLKATHNQR